MISRASIKMNLRHNGFTLVELVLAAAVSSVALVAVTAGLIQLFKLYQSSVSIRTTQASARTISEELTRAAREAHTVVGRNGSICFYYPKSKGASAGNLGQTTGVRYSVNPDFIMSKATIKGYVIPEAGADCREVDFSSASQTQVSEGQVQIRKFDASASQTKFMDIDLRIATESAAASELDTDDDGNPVCKPGYEYCSMTVIKKTVMARAEDDK